VKIIPSTGCGPGLVIDISHGILHSRLKSSFTQDLYLHAIYPLLKLISWNSTIQCLAATGGGTVGNKFEKKTLKHVFV